MPVNNPLRTSKQYQSVLKIASDLITRRSITPYDAGCQNYIAAHLRRLGFECQQFEVAGVSNLIAHIGTGQRQIAFSGHTDVVPPGPSHRWCSDPFEPVMKNGRLYGRGAADMKTGVAAFLSACEKTNWVKLDPDITFWVLITSDEEGEAISGSAWIKQYLDDSNVQLDAVLVGEPTAARQTGDTVKLGRRGALSGRVVIKGKQGHVAYPQQTTNAAAIAAVVADRLTRIPFPKGSADFPGTSLQITHLNSGEFNDNIVPGQCEICFNIRYSDDVDVETLKAKIADIVDINALQYKLFWERPCQAYLSQPNTSEGFCLINRVESAIQKVTGKYPLLSTAGGTSDGRFFASPFTQVVELGVPNNTIHQVNENIELADLFTLEDIYSVFLTDLAPN